jgi:hypothetical protein
VKRNGKPLKAHGSDRAPHTAARVLRRGRRFLLRLSAKASSGVAATYIQIGKAPAKLYHKPLLLTKAELKHLHFASVDRFGHWERAETARVPR